MKVALYTNIVSPHQLPLAREILALVGEGNFCYIYSQACDLEREKLGWGSVSGDWLLYEGSSDSVKIWLENADVLLVGGLRPLDLLERRASKGLKTFYQSERWFKPIPISPFISIHLCLPGWFRMVVPSYRKMVRRFVNLVKKDSNLRVLSIGPWAKHDFLKMGVSADKIVDWGYFVAPSDAVRKQCKFKEDQCVIKRAIRVLWVGRMLRLKRVDTIIRAIRSLDPANFSFTILGVGPEYSRLLRFAAGAPNIVFKGAVPISEIRQVMRQHDVYVFSSNAEDGWGAVVSEALEEGMYVLGTRESGAPATLLPKVNLFSCGNWQELAMKLSRLRLPLEMLDLPRQYTAKGAAERLMMELV